MYRLMLLLLTLSSRVFSIDPLAIHKSPAPYKVISPETFGR